MSPSTRLAALAVLALPLSNALAQTSPTPDTATLLKKIEEQDRRIEALEHKLEVLENQQAAATGAAGANGAAAASAATPAVGPAPGASSATVAQQRGRQATSAPPVPQTTGALPGSPSTAVQGSTAAVSQRAATASEAPGLVTAGSVKAGATGFSFASEDSANVIRFRGNFAFDGRWFPDRVDPVSADTFLFRKVRPIIEGTIDNDYDFRFMPEFGGGKSIILTSNLELDQ